MLRGLLVVAAVAAVALAQNPAFMVAVTNQGLDYARKTLIPILEAELQHLTIPDVSGSAGTPIGSIDYTLSNIKAQSISLGTSQLDVQPSGIQVADNSVSVKLTANWHYREHSWPHVSDSGSVDIGASGVGINVVIGVGVTDTHEPSVATNACSANIGDLDIDFHGGASWLYNLFKSEIADSLKGSLRDELCSIIKQEINGEGNKALSTLPTQEKLDDYAVINFELIKPPTLTSQFILTSHKGEFFNVNNPVETPFTPAALPDPTSGSLSRMMYLYLSNYMFESAGFVYQRSGFLHYNVTPEEVPPNIPFKLNTSSFAALIPALYNKYPNRLMNLTVDALAPFVNLTITPSGATLNARIGISPVVILSPTQGAPTFTLNATVQASATAFVQPDGGKQYIRGNLTFVKVDLALASTEIGPVDLSVIQSLVDLFAQKAFLPYFNKILAKGFPIPAVDGITFDNPQVSFGYNCVIIDTDVTYNPSVLKNKK